MESFKPQVLVLGPGGAKGYLELGALWSVSSILKSVNTYIGCSVGAVLSLLLVSGYTPEEIITDAIESRFFHDLPSVNMTSIQKGILPNNSIREHLIHRIRSKLGFVPTLQRLYMATGINLIIVATNITEGKVDYLSKDSDPDLDCVEAVMLSVAIPIITGKAVYKNRLYADGVFGNPYPVDLLDDSETPILGLYIEDVYKDDEMTAPLCIYRTVYSPIEQLKRRIVTGCSKSCKHIFLQCTKHDLTGVTWSDDIIVELVLEGYEEGKKFMLKLSNISDPIDANVA